MNLKEQLMEFRLMILFIFFPSGKNGVKVLYN